jgi:hypothetical protein
MDGRLSIYTKLSIASCQYFTVMSTLPLVYLSSHFSDKRLYCIAVQACSARSKEGGSKEDQP